jgi:hypothetical protein
VKSVEEHEQLAGTDAGAGADEAGQQRALTLRQLVAEYLAGWMDAGVEYVYEDGDANPPLICLYDPQECPILHRELDRLVADCQVITFVKGWCLDETTQARLFSLAKDDRRPPELHIQFADGGAVWLVPNK